MSSYSLTKSRAFQYVGILLALAAIAAGYWYFSVRASTKVNKTATGSLTSGLVGYWTFDGADTTSTTITDKSGNGYNATRNGVTTVTPGRIGQAMSLDGEDVTNITASGSSLNNLTQFTACAWVNPATFTNPDSDPESIILGKVWYLRVNNSGQVRFSISTSGAYPTAFSSVNLATNRWQHLCGVAYGVGTEPKLFLDGVDVSSNTDGGAGTQTSDSAHPFTIGSQHDNDSYVNYKGKIDDVRVYNRTLSATEVAGLYDMGKVKLDTRPGDDVLEEGLAGYWKLDESSGTSAGDASGNASTGTLTNMEDPGDWVAGRIGNSLNFDGSNEYVNLGAPAALNLPGAMTACAWIYAESVPISDARIIANNDTGGGVHQYSIEVETDRAVDFFWTNNAGTVRSLVTTGPIIEFNAWYHVCAVRNSTTAGTIYSNGIAQPTTVSGGAVATTGYGNTTIGRAGSTSASYFDGKIDEVRVYHRALSAEEVALLYRETHPDDPDTHLVGHWTLDGMDVSGTTAIDRGRGGNRGTLTNSPTVTPGRLGQALNFNGPAASQYVAIADPGTASVLDFGSGNSITLSAWVKPTGFTVSGADGAVILMKGATNDSDNANYSLISSSSGCTTTCKASFAYVSGGGAQAHIYETNTNVLPLNTWTHLAVTYTFGTGGSIVFYVNGSVQSGTWITGTGNSAPDQTNNALWIGADDYHAAQAVDEEFTGALDDVRIYDTALTATQIVDLYRAGGGKAIAASSGNDTLRSGLVGLWSMDGQDVNWADTTTEVKDDTANANHGDATNMSAASAAPGRIGQAMNFDGVNQSVNMGSSAVYANLNTKTVSAWIKPSGLTTYRGITGIGTWAFQICSNDATDCNGTTGRIVYYHEFSGTEGKWILGANSVTANQWAHVVVTYDRTSTANDPVIYVNGVSQSVTELSAPTGTANNETGTSLQIGYDGYAYAMGAIDDVRVYNRILSADEVTQLYNLGR